MQEQAWQIWNLRQIQKFVLARGKMREVEKKPAQIRAKVAELKWHSCPWSTVVVKTKKKDGYSSEHNE